jgi:hypothetical protein
MAAMIMMMMIIIKKHLSGILGQDAEKNIWIQKGRSTRRTGIMYDGTLMMLIFHQMTLKR